MLWTSTISGSLITHYIEAAAFHTFICRLPNASLLEVEATGQLDFIGRQHIDRTLFNALTSCVKSLRLNVVGCDPFGIENVSINAQCQAKSGRRLHPPAVHHIKYLILVYETPDGKQGSVGAFGSGNISAGSLTVNIEDWLIAAAHNSSGSWWKCLIELGRNLAQVEIDATAVRYRDCAGRTPKRFPVTQPDGQLQLFIMPFDAGRFFARLESDIRGAKHVQIVAQFFESARIKEMISMNSATRFTIYIDAAYVIAKETGQPAGFITPQMASDFFGFLRSSSNVEVRYLQMNHEFERTGFANTVHARSIYISRPDGDVSMIGSAHFRDGAFLRNTEQQIFLSGEAARTSAPFFDALRSRSVAYADVPVSLTK